MSAKVYVGNLSWNTTDDSLRHAFSDFGNILDSIVMRDRDTGRSRGFGFVTFGSEDEANGAISAMNDQDLDGRRIKVNLAHARTGGGGGGGGGYSGSASGGGGGGGGSYGGYGGQNPGYQSGGGYGGYGGNNPYQGQGQGYGGGAQSGGYPSQGYGGNYGGGY